MMKTQLCVGVLLSLVAGLTWAQIPRRIQISGAIPVGIGPGDRPLPARRLIQQPLNAPVRVRRPFTNAIPAPLPIRPVVEESEDLPSSSLNLNEEALRLAQLPIQGPTQIPRQQLFNEDEEDEPAPKQFISPVQFRPERPPIQVAQPARLPPPPQPIRQQAQPIRTQPVRQAAPRPRPQYADDENVPRRDRVTQPPVKILRKYREDNPDGSITWGFENDDGTFKEETIGVDCITRGKYGYIDPDGNRREYTYETGLKCDQPDEEDLPEEDFVQQPIQTKQYKRPQPLPQPIRLQ